MGPLGLQDRGPGRLASLRRQGRKGAAFRGRLGEAAQPLEVSVAWEWSSVAQM